MDNNLNLWSGIELTWENILARTFYGTDIYSTFSRPITRTTS